MDYALEAISMPIYGEDLYPEIFSKASALICSIVKRHVFRDGNKRTGIEAARLFLAKNDYLLTTQPDDADYILRVAECTADQNAVSAWLRQKSVARTN